MELVLPIAGQRGLGERRGGERRNGECRVDTHVPSLIVNGANFRLTILGVQHIVMRVSQFSKRHTVPEARRYWMDERSIPGQELAVAHDLKILKLSDEFGQYTLALKCSACNHERHAQPHALARLCGWDARIDAVTRRLRCSKCGKKQCTWRAYPPSKPRGHSSLPR